ncbi:MAG TPA: PQQ-dependent sugar dehydrogenase [Mycobacteriales bacterium]|nr:PQQ-dependent sugar dehydrogenase [Mycobacteriales bacterium]
MTAHVPTLRSRRQARAPLTGDQGGSRPARGRGRGVAVFVAALSAAGLAACSSDQPAADGTPSATRASSAAGGGSSASGSAAPAGQVSVIASRLEAPWGIAFLPDGDALVTERDSARILRVPAGGGDPAEVQTLSEVDGDGEGGLLGIAVSPTYADDQTVFVYYSTADDNRIATLRLGQSPQPIVTGIPRSGIHNGGRLVFGPDGYLYAGTGDASSSGRSQDTNSLGGKILRMTADGKPAPGNPFGNLVWTYGHRNVQGLVFDSAGRLWASEFGQNRFDEVNLIQRGKNYGWPTVEGATDDPRFQAPLVTWPTSDASPSGVTIAGSTLYVAALRGERLWEVPLQGDRTGTPRAALQDEYGRLRAVQVAPDGSLWILTSNRDGRGDPTGDDDRILRMTV